LVFVLFVLFDFLYGSEYYVDDDDIQTELGYCEKYDTKTIVPSYKQ